MATRQKNSRWRTPREIDKQIFSLKLLRRLASPLMVAIWVSVGLLLVYVFGLFQPHPAVMVRGLHSTLPGQGATDGAPWDLLIDQPGFQTTSRPQHRHAAGNTVSDHLRGILGEIEDAPIGLFYYDVPGVVVTVPSGKEKPGLLSAAWLDSSSELDLTDLAVKLSEVEEWLEDDDSSGSRATADRYAIVVLDCQISAQLQARGLYRRDFVGAAKSQLARWLQGPRREHVVVVLSCDENQVSWVDPASGESVFGHYFTEGVRGAADAADGTAEDDRVSVSEVIAFARRYVRNWVRTHRGVDQHVVALYPKRGSREVWGKVYLNPHKQQTIARVTSLGSALASQSADDASSLARLESLWTLCYSQWDVSVDIDQLDPHQWSRIFQQLLNAEYALRYNVPEGFAASMESARRLLDAVKENAAANWKSRNYSLAFEDRVRQHQLDTPVGAGPGGESELSVPDLQSLESAGSGVPATKGSDPQPSLPATVAGNCGGNPQQKTAANPVVAEGDNNVSPPAARTAKDASDTTVKETQPSPNGMPSGTTRDRKSAAATGGSSDPNPGGGTVSREDIERTFTTRLTRFIDGTDTARQVVDGLSGYDVMLPVELEAIVMSVGNRSRASLGVSMAERDDRLREVLKTRSQLERAWCAGGGFAPYVTQWLQPQMRTADAWQRRQEDLLWAWSDIPIHSPGSLADHRNGEMSDLVMRVRQTGLSLQRWKRALALAPFLLRFNSESGGSGVGLTDDQFTQRMRGLSVAQFRILGELTQKFARPSEDLGQWVREIGSGSLKLAQLGQDLVGEFDRRIEGITVEQEVTVKRWRQVDQLLRFPVLTAGSPGERARKRIALVIHSMKHIAEVNGLGASIPANGNAEEDSVPVPASPSLLDVVRAYAGVDGAGESGFDRTAEGTVSGDQLWSRIARSVIYQDVATRALLRFGLSDFRKAPRVTDVESQRAQRWAEFYCQLGLRRLEDFWGRQVNGRMYYQRSSNACLKQARALQQESASTLYGLVQDRQQALNRVVLTARYQDQDRSGLVEFFHGAAAPREQTEDAEWLGVDLWPMTARLRMGSELPAGVLGMRRPRSPSIDVEYADDTDAPSSEVQLTLRRDNVAVTLGEPLVFQLRYRGHVWPAPVSLKLVNEQEWGVLNVSDGAVQVARLSVEPADRDLAKTSVLFVLDCSRSMAQGARMETLVNTLDKFSQLVQGSRIQVGVRFFGHRHEWVAGNEESEKRARQDSELKMPIQEFNSNALPKFKKLLDELAPRGETPLFYALLQAAADFQTVENGRKLVVVITDGVDNWSRSAGSRYSVDRVGEILSTAGIRVNAIGFDTDAIGFGQLEEIAAVTGGTAVDASSSALFNRLLAAIEPVYYRVQKQGSSEVVITPRLVPMGLARPIDISPGVFDVFVMDHNFKTVASKQNVAIDAGQEHRLVYREKQLEYDAPAFRQDMAHSSREDQPVLRIVRAARKASGALRLTVSVVDEENDDWGAEVLSVDIQSLDGGRRRYLLPGMLANDAVGRFSAWTYELADWDDEITRVKVTARWVTREQLSAARDVYLWYPGKTDPLKIPGMEVTRNQFPVELHGQGGWARLTLLAGEDATAMPWDFQLASPNVSSAAAVSVHSGKRLATFFYRFKDVQGGAPYRLVRMPEGIQRREVTMRMSLGSVLVTPEQAENP